MNTFKKEERLCSKKLSEKLFHSGSSFLVYPFKINWLIYNLPAGVYAQVLISTPKRRFKKAVDRNLLKRRMREIYRIHKKELLYNSLNGNTLLVGITYIGNDTTGFEFMNDRLRQALSKLAVQCQEGYAE